MKTLFLRGLGALVILLAFGSAQLTPSQVRGGPGPPLCLPEGAPCG